MEELLDAVSPAKRKSQAGRRKPHKIIMLLAALDYARSTADWSGEIPPSREVESRFELYFGLVRQSDDRPNMANPFLHLRSSSFWKLVPAEGFGMNDLEALKKTGLMAVIRRKVSHAYAEERMQAIFRSPEMNLEASRRLVRILQQESQD